MKKDLEIKKSHHYICSPLKQVKILHSRLLYKGKQAKEKQEKFNIPP